MNKHITLFLVLVSSLLSAAAYASVGEYWEITVKMDMPGMPFAMPAQTVKVCQAKDKDIDPKKLNQNKDCQISNFKKSGNKISYNVSCDQNGDVMTGDAEYTVHADSAEGIMHLSGKSHGNDMKMTQTTSGKRVGGSCDPEAENKERSNKQEKMKADMEKMSHEQKEQQEAQCVSYTKDNQWINMAEIFFGNQPICPGRQTQLCDSLRKDAPKDATVYDALVTRDKQAGARLSVAKECKLNMAATTKSVCKTFTDKNYETLAKYCPADAKAFREAKRRKECEGREYTAVTPAEGIKKCMSGMESNDNSSSENTASASHKQNKTTPGEKPAAEKPVEDSSSNVINGATNLLKGHFGF